jgi:mannosyltransferase
MAGCFNPPRMDVEMARLDLRPSAETPNLQVKTDDRRSQLFLAGLAGLILLGALALRYIGVSHRGLWNDELLSANFSSHGPLETILTVLRFDIHPPLYYVQLSLWSLLGSSPIWLMANSIVWSVAAVGLLLVYAGRAYGARTGLTAAALLAVAPAALAYSDQVRMYAFISMLMVWVWRRQEQWAARPTWRSWLLMTLSQLCVVYAHTAGVFMISGCVLYGAIRTATELDRGGVRRWLLAEAVVGLLAAPVLLLGQLHTVTHPLAPTLADALMTWTFLGSGAANLDGLHTPLAAAVGLALLAIAAATPRLRLQIATLVFAPLLLAAAFSYAVKPIWLDRIFAPIIPFIALVFARFAAERDIGAPGAAPLRAGAVGALGLVWLIIGVSDQATRAKGDGNQDLAAYVLHRTRSGDAVVFNKDLELWTVMWAIEGRRWGDPIHAYLASDPGNRLTRMLPPALRARFLPTKTAYRINGVDVLLSDGRPEPDPSGDLIAIGVNPLTAPGRVLIERSSFPPLILERWRRAPAQP